MLSKEDRQVKSDTVFGNFPFEDKRIKMAFLCRQKETNLPFERANKCLHFCVLLITHSTVTRLGIFHQKSPQKILEGCYFGTLPFLYSIGFIRELTYNVKKSFRKNTF